MFDLMIIGGGPAGMTSAVYAARKKLNTILLSKDIGGQVNWTLGIENYMGYQLIEGAELVKKFEDQVKQFPLEIKLGLEVISLSHENGTFKANADNNESYQAKAVIIASGKRPRPLNVPGEDRLRSKGVTYCAICDGPLFAGMKVAVIGGGNSALEAADDMIKIADQVYVVSLTQFTGDQVLVDKINGATNLTTYLEHEVLEITGDKFVNGIIIRDLKSREEKQLAVSGVFIEIGLIPNSDYAKGIANLNNSGEVEVNISNETSISGLFAAGDVTNISEKQIVVAAGEGAKAALQAHHYLQRLAN